MTPLSTASTVSKVSRVDWGGADRPVSCERSKFIGTIVPPQPDWNLIARLIFFHLDCLAISAPSETMDLRS